MKDKNDVIHEFNDIVNMTVPELEKWLKTGDSTNAGWSKDDGSGESVGHDSGRKIIEILKSNPNKKPDKYTDDQISHMRKVVSYCKRHLAQEERANQEKPVEEVKQTKSYASLKNWGHDPLKNRDDAGGDNDDGDEDEGDGEEQAGDKRKKSSNGQAQSNKKRETRQGKGTSNGQKKTDEEEDDDEDEEDDDYDEDSEDDDDDDEDGESDDDEEDGEDDDGKENGESSGKKPKKGPKPGEKVSWPWGGGNPEGKVLDVKAEDTTITTKRGSKVTRKGDEEDPAVVLDTGKSKAVKSNHELD